MLRHLLPYPVLQPVHGPRLSFRDVNGHAALQREKASSVSLHARSDPQVSAPSGKALNEPLLKKLRLRCLEIKPHAAYRLQESRSVLHSIPEIRNIAHGARPEQYKWQEGENIIAPPFEKLLPHVTCPVGALKLHAVSEECTKMVRKRPGHRFNGV